MSATTNFLTSKEVEDKIKSCLSENLEVKIKIRYLEGEMQVIVSLCYANKLISKSIERIIGI